MIDAVTQQVLQRNSIFQNQTHNKMPRAEVTAADFLDDDNDQTEQQPQQRRNDEEMMMIQPHQQEAKRKKLTKESSFITREYRSLGFAPCSSGQVELKQQQTDETAKSSLIQKPNNQSEEVTLISTGFHGQFERQREVASDSYFFSGTRRQRSPEQKEKEMKNLKFTSKDLDKALKMLDQK